MVQTPTNPAECEHRIATPAVLHSADSTSRQISSKKGLYMTDPWQTYADAYAFFGNSLLKPITQTETVGLDPAFWDAFPDFGDSRIACAIERCKSVAEHAQGETGAAGDAVRNAALEYTRLFVGPPSPAAPPWETMNRAEGVTVGFGQPTFDMQEVLRGMGLQVGGRSNQYADHMGIELLALSKMCLQAGEGRMAPSDICAFMSAHPLGWVGTFRSKVHASYPGGYYDRLIGLAEAVMAHHSHQGLFLSSEL